MHDDELVTGGDYLMDRRGLELEKVLGRKQKWVCEELCAPATLQSVKASRH